MEGALDGFAAAGFVVGGACAEVVALLAASGVDDVACGVGPVLELTVFVLEQEATMARRAAAEAMSFRYRTPDTSVIDFLMSVPRSHRLVARRWTL
jgi:hypothetical protein